MNDRGKFTNKDRARQLIAFEGMKYGNITPTDIDGVIEYHNKGYVIFEVKHGEKDVPYGQKLAIQRMVADTGRIDSGKKSLAIICEHNVEDPNESVMAKDCMVREVFYSDEQRWRATKRPMKVGELVELFISLIDPDVKPF